MEFARHFKAGEADVDPVDERGHVNEEEEGQEAARDLAPGEKSTDVIGIKCTDGNQPRLYQLNFGIDQNLPVTAEAVL